MKIKFDKSDIKRLSLVLGIIFFWGFNVLGIVYDSLKFKTWLGPVCWMIGNIIYKIFEQSGNRFYENTGVVSHIKLREFLYIGVIGITLLPIMEFTFFQRVNPTLSIIGLIVLVAAGIIRYLALKTLGEYFSTHVEVYKGHRVVDEKIYSLIRHPGYLATVLLSVGSLLTVNAYYSTVFLVFYYIPIMLLRVRFEEQTLKQYLSEYAEYCMRTKRFIPYLL